MGVVDEGRSVSSGTPPPLTAEGVVAAVLGVLHVRLLRGDGEPLIDLLPPLMSMIMLPYLGAHEAGRELMAPPPQPRGPGQQPRAADAEEESLDGLDMRLTYRTVRVLMALSECPGASNRQIAERSGISAQGQISKLLTRLARLKLVTNSARVRRRGCQTHGT